jgi:hypothetical protein
MITKSKSDMQKNVIRENTNEKYDIKPERIAN